MGAPCHRPQPKSGRRFLSCPILAIRLSEFGSTLAAEISVFQALSAGNGIAPFIFALIPVEAAAMLAKLGEKLVPAPAVAHVTSNVAAVVFVLELVLVLVLLVVLVPVTVLPVALLSLPPPPPHAVRLDSASSRVMALIFRTVGAGFWSFWRMGMG